MYIELLHSLKGEKLNKWITLTKKCNLEPDDLADVFVLIWEDNQLIATAQRYENIIKCIAVDDKYRGEGVTASLITELKKDAGQKGIHHLFLYTKPQNKPMFSDLFFYPVAETENVLLMEDKNNGINNFLNQFPDAKESEKNGCIVANCNPFTLGHLYLIEEACKECDNLYVFVVSEDKSMFSTKERLKMVKDGTRHLKNVTVLPTGPYLISFATFPDYFLKKESNIPNIKCRLDIEIFAKYYAPKFNIKTRFVGTEPFCAVTNEYNNELKKLLPQKNITLKEIKRKRICDEPVSASRVRDLITKKDIITLKSLVPDTTLEILSNLSKTKEV